jgi:hypothetical protein
MNYVSISIDVQRVAEFAQQRIRRYGFIHIPMTPGLHTLEVNTRRPQGTFIDQGWCTLDF